MSIKVYKGIGKRLRDLRKNRGLSLDSVARENGFSILTLGKIERGENYPSVENLVKLTNYYNTNSDYIIGLTHDSGQYSPVAKKIAFLLTEQNEKSQAIIEATVIALVNQLRYERVQ